jgi:hypothetical protein
MSLIDHVLPGVKPGALWIEDRNFCTTRLVFGIWGQGGSFLVRQHQSTLSRDEITPWVAVGRLRTGMVHEPTIGVRDPASNATRDLRRIRWDLDQPTEDNETVILLLTDVPKERADALLLSETDRRRWRLENVFPTRPEALTCAIHTLADPKAALFGFCTALVMANVRAALRSEPGREVVETTVSNCSLANEVSTKYEGMMIAIEPSEWTPFPRLSDSARAEFLREAASQVWLSKYPRSRRGPKQPPPKKTRGRKNHHVSTARLLDKQIQQK